MKLGNFTLKGNVMTIDARLDGNGKPEYCITIGEDAQGWMSVQDLRQLCASISKDIGALFYVYTDDPKSETIAEFEEAWNPLETATIDEEKV